MQEIKMPSAGQTTDEALIAKINVRVGDSVKRGDVLVETETDKAVLPVESYAAGQVLEILVSEGDRVDAGHVLMRLGKPEEAGAAQPPAKQTSAKPEKAEAEAEAALPDDYQPIVKGSAPRKTAKTGTGKWPAMPNAKKLSAELGIELSGIAPSNGRFIKRADILAGEKTHPGAQPEYDVLPMSRIRGIIAKRMLESTTGIPAWQCTMAVNMEPCMALRKLFLEKKNIKLSYNDIVAAAIAAASREFSLIRARYEEGELRCSRHCNIGLAVGLEGALVVPVVKNVDEMGLEQISAAYRAQVEKAREGRLGPGDMGGGSITISNLGMYEVKEFTAIVNPPESAILALGGISVQPVWDGSAFVPAHMMNMTGSFDHRFIDGAYGAKFMQELKKLLENPILLLG